MGERIFDVFALRAGRLARGTVSQISAINKKYMTPHITTTPAVRVALLMLRLYLLALVGILIYKFITLVR